MMRCQTEFQPAKFVALGLLLAAIPLASAHRISRATAAPAAERKIGFDEQVRPILAQNCFKCHGPEKQKSNFRLDVKESALHEGEIGGAISPGNSSKSKLIQYVTSDHDEMRMPPKGTMLSPGEVDLIRAWIDEGAVWGTAKPATMPVHWSLRPIATPAVPTVSQMDRVRTPIDAFILSKLAEKGLTYSTDADRRSLIRRVTLDLTGLLPTPQEADAFLADPSDTAFEKVVDRLLASERYGERWARHWMDLVHYAETHGHDEDKPRPNAWPYRDYLIRSFNSDKPYARFVEEQLAGDVLFAGQADSIVATAFNAVGPWDESSQQGISDGTLDKQFARYMDRDDMVTTAMSTFVSSTVHCARCHEHKFDPISQADYYALQAVFGGVDRIDREYDRDPALVVRRNKLQQERTALENETAANNELMRPEVLARVADWEKAQSTPPVWKVLEPKVYASSGGATLTPQGDGSLLASGLRPEKDVYTISAESPLRQISAIRLEVLADPSLPHQGPGRQPENGNLHLSELSAGYIRKKPATQPASTAPEPLPIARVTADFDQTDWGAAKSIDGNPQTAWGIHPQEGHSHWVIFELSAPVNLEPGGELSFSLQQLHGRSHLIGRPRLSVTASVLPLKVSACPDDVAAVLATPASRRTTTQTFKLTRHVQLRWINAELASLPSGKAMVYTIASNFPAEGNFKPAITPRQVHVLRRGDIRQPTEVAAPGAMSCLGDLPSRFQLPDSNDEGSRRAALAKWVTHPKNVLAWRSIVNRIWQYHFGRGIVQTPSDFGKMGAAPTHPLLLDWLTVQFQQSGGSIKKLHRLIVLSTAYRQSSASNPKAAAIDADNQLLWQMNRPRLDGEEVHDCILAISGKLDLRMGGPSDKQFVESKGVHVTPVVDYAAFDIDSPAAWRRSVYRFVFRTVPDPFMQSLDCPDASQLTPKREISVTALQALAMLNDRFVIRQSEYTAERIAIAGDVSAQIKALYRLAFNRLPDDDELQWVTTYSHQHGMANTVRMLLNSNEFMFVQ